ncbi:MAG: hypothetical protein ACREIT_12265 [Tepidisphaeraceae bacterium]
MRVLAVIGSAIIALAMCHDLFAEPSTMPATRSSESCSLSPEQLAARRQQLIPGLFERAREVTDIENGLRFRFDGKAGLLTDLVKVIEQERDCCSFLRFQLTAESHAGAVTLDVTGPEGTGEMLRKL